MKIIYARIISLEPPLANNGKSTFKLNIPPSIKVKLGDWVGIEPTNTADIYAVIELGNKTSTDFPGHEWQRLQTPIVNDLTRFQILRLRSKILNWIREFFNERGFWEVETPLMVNSPGVETHLTAIKAGNKFLSPSPEFQMKRLLAGGSGSIFQITKSFRGDEQGTKHNPEFTMLEWYSVGTDSEGLRCETEDLLMFLQNKIRLKIFPKPPWKRLSIASAFLKYADINNIFSFEELKSKIHNSFVANSWEEAFFYVFVNFVEPKLTSNGPVFLTHWPSEFASLSRILPDNPKFADRFELFIQDLEIANGFGELLDGEEQRRRSNQDVKDRQNLSKEIYPTDEKFFNALDEGMPPVSGIALGVDRLIMLLTGTSDIQNVLSFSANEL